jgi:hypothetical protein
MKAPPRIKQHKAGACRQECEGIQVTEQLWVCPHTAWGWQSNLKGAVDEARRMIERAGGYNQMLIRQRARRSA